MTFRPPPPLSLRDRLLGGGIASAAGVFIILIATGVIPTHEGLDPSQRVMGLAGGGMFLGAGLLMLGQGGQLAQIVAGGGGLLLVAGILVLFNWLAFGPGVRECTRTIGGLISLGPDRASDLECRVVAGLAAFIIDAFAFLVFAATVSVVYKDAPWTQPLVTLSKRLLLLSLAPFLLIVVLVLFATGNAGVIKATVARSVARWREHGWKSVLKG